MQDSCDCRGQLSQGIHIPSLMQQTAPAQPSFYRRQLPSPPAIDFASEEGKGIFTEALASGGLACFFPLIAQFQTQAEPAYCGLASLSVALNALSIDPGRTWKGPWRWFDEALLDCCEPLETIKQEGIVLSKVACLARCNGAAVKTVLASKGSEEAFREDVRRTSAEGKSNIVVGYSRKVLLQTGDGHFSPIGGYHAARDLVLILDVARFKYPPHWVPLPLLWQAMQRTDEASGQSRGYLVLSPRGQPSAALFTLARPDAQWWAVARYASRGVQGILQRTGSPTAERALASVLEGLQHDVTHLVTWMRAAPPAGESALTIPSEGRLVQSVKDEVLRQLRALKLHAMVSRWAAEKSEGALDTRDGSAEAGSQNGGASQTTEEAQEKEAAEASRTLLEETCSSLSEKTRGRLSEETRDSPCPVEARSKRQLLGPTSAPKCKRLGPSVREASDGRGGCTEVPLVRINSLQAELPNGRKHAEPLCLSTNSHGSRDEGSLQEAVDEPTRVDLLAVFLLLCPSEVWASARDPSVREELQLLTKVCCLPSTLHSEVLHLKEQFAALQTESSADTLTEHP